MTDYFYSTAALQEVGDHLDELKETIDDQIENARDVIAKAKEERERIAQQSTADIERLSGACDALNAFRQFRLYFGGSNIPEFKSLNDWIDAMPEGLQDALVSRLLVLRLEDENRTYSIDKFTENLSELVRDLLILNRDLYDHVDALQHLEDLHE